MGQTQKSQRRNIFSNLPRFAPVQRTVKVRRNVQFGTQPKRLEAVYELGGLIGRGQFGVICECTCRATGKKFACKTIHKTNLLQEGVADFQQEVETLRLLSGHPNVVKLEGVYEDPHAVHIVMELCTGGPLMDRITDQGEYCERAAAGIMRTVLGVVEHCHSRRIMHRDIKLSNFLLADPSDLSTIKAIDFGTSVSFTPGEVLTQMVGSPAYCAPEVLEGSYGPESDIWSCGVTRFILLSGCSPFERETILKTFEAVKEAEFSFDQEPWPRISPSAKDLVAAMLAKDPMQRPSAAAVLEHEWIREDGCAPEVPLQAVVLPRLRQFTRMSSFHRAILMVVGSHISAQELATLKQLYSSMDTDGNGTITMEELRVGMRNIGLHMTEEEIGGIMETADVDKNGTIDYGEFIAATMNLSQGLRKEAITKAFSQLDLDGNGYLTVDELRSACAGIQFLSSDEIALAIRDADENNDGLIDLQEFVELVAGDSGSQSRRRQALMVF